MINTYFTYSVLTLYGCHDLTSSHPKEAFLYNLNDEHKTLKYSLIMNIIKNVVHNHAVCQKNSFR